MSDPRRKLRDRIEIIMGIPCEVFHALEQASRLTVVRKGKPINRVPLPILMGMAQKESTFDPGKIGANDDRGLLQIRQPAWQQICDWEPSQTIGFEYHKDWLDPFKNATVGALYMQWIDLSLLQEGLFEGDATGLAYWEPRLWGYNGGLSKVMSGTTPKSAIVHACAVLGYAREWEEKLERERIC